MSNEFCFAKEDEDFFQNDLCAVARQTTNGMGNGKEKHTKNINTVLK